MLWVVYLDNWTDKSLNFCSFKCLSKELLQTDYEFYVCHCVSQVDTYQILISK